MKRLTKHTIELSGEEVQQMIRDWIGDHVGSNASIESIFYGQVSAIPSNEKMTIHITDRDEEVID